MSDVSDALDRLEAMERGAPAAPWHSNADPHYSDRVYDAEEEWLLEGAGDFGTFIAAARNSLPALIRVARAALAIYDEAGEAPGDWPGSDSWPQLRAALDDLAEAT